MAKPKTPLFELSYGLYVVGTKDKEVPNGMIANWITQVSFDPEIVAVAIEKDSHMRAPILAQCGARKAHRWKAKWEVRAP